jgi:hypothetical protein
MTIGRETEVLRENLPQCHSVYHKSHMTWPEIEPGRRDGTSATNHLRYGPCLTKYYGWTVFSVYAKGLWTRLIILRIPGFLDFVHRLVCQRTEHFRSWIFQSSGERWEDVYSVSLSVKCSSQCSQMSLLPTQNLFQNKCKNAFKCNEHSINK